MSGQRYHGSQVTATPPPPPPPSTTSSTAHTGAAARCPVPLGTPCPQPPTCYISRAAIAAAAGCRQVPPPGSRLDCVACLLLSFFAAAAAAAAATTTAPPSPSWWCACPQQRCRVPLLLLYGVLVPPVRPLWCKRVRVLAAEGAWQRGGGPSVVPHASTPALALTRGGTTAKPHGHEALTP